MVILMNSNKYLKWLIGAILSASSALAFSQPEVNFDELRLKYPEVDVVVLKKNLDISIEIINGQPEVINKYEEVYAFLTDKANYFSTKSVGYSEHFEELIRIDATSFIPEKGKLKKIIADKPEFSDHNSENIFYDDYKKATVTFKALQKGSIGILNYAVKCKDPHLLHSFTMGAYAPITHATLNVEFPDEVSINPKTYDGYNKTPFNFFKTKKKNKNVWTWEAKNIEKYNIESNAPNYYHSALRIFPLIKEYDNGKNKQRVLSDINDLFSWYSKQVKNLNDTISPLLKYLADSLTSEKSELEKIKSVYYWVQDNVRYIAIEDGWGGFIPRKADDVCNKRYGDCKDMANLCKTLLNIAGVDAKLAWIGTRDIPYTYNDVPSTDSDNHMICAVNYNNYWYFLDATAAFIDFGLPSDFIQGKTALIMINPDSFLLEKIEPVNQSINNRTDTIQITLSGNMLKGVGHCSYNGYWKHNMANAFIRKHSATRYDDLKKYFSTGNNKCKVDTIIQNTELKSRDNPLNFRYTFSISDYVKTSGKNKFINMNLDRPMENSLIDTLKRKNPFEFDFLSVETQVIKLTVPDKHMVNYIPPDRKYKSDVAAFELTYTTSENSITLTRSIHINTLTFDKNHFKEWNEMNAELNKAYKEIVTLTETD
ncbi:MAG: hypothetical protein POELPBGB_00067 [Bacteroidia bacterium]|nr:hypothetical protein [Bacteroidia bacterium]